MHRLVDPELLRLLMQRTGTGARVTIRQLGAAAGVPHGTIGNLLAGLQESVAGESAYAIAAALGVDVLVLWIPVERAGGVQIAPQMDEADVA
ncbi:XRE family transcriptional regulator [Streptomyces sp. NPDC059534]|uniref:XRE family transcriptional regulator n=1 Tax=Streptomyces sp. NPDC059534 TaxID=3346859 RepID=UPI0036B74CE6